MMKVKKVAQGNTSLEDALNDFFAQERIRKEQVFDIKPISIDSASGISDHVWVYVFWDDGR